MLEQRTRRRSFAENVLLLTAGIALWVAYGVLRGDLVIIAANSVSLCFLAVILYFKLRPRGSAAGGVLLRYQRPEVALHAPAPDYTMG